MNPKTKKLAIVCVTFLLLLFPAGYLASENLSLHKQILKLRGLYSKLSDEEIAVVNTVKNAQSAVVSVVIRKEVFAPSERLLDLGNGFEIIVPGEVVSKGKQIIGQGSGFLVDRNGLIVTNKHVVADTNAEYQVVFAGGVKARARVVASDPFNDIALLKINNGSLPTAAQPLTLGNNSDIHIGQTVIAIGNALGELQNTVTKGVISAVNRSIAAGDEIGGRSERLVNIIQTDAAINPGNSGGPLLSTNGEVLGINTAVNRGAENIGFAIAVDDIKFALNSYSQNGEIIRPLLGIRYALLNSELKKNLHVPYSKGALLVKGDSGEPAVVSGSAAAKAGLAEGDIILKINDIVIDADHEPAAMLRDTPVGETIKLKVWKASTGREEIISVKLTAIK